MEKYLTYINNAGNPTVEEFIEDWEPVGWRIIEHLKDEGLIRIENNRLYVVS